MGLENINIYLYGEDARNDVLFPREDVTVHSSTPLLGLDDQPRASKLYIGFGVWSLNHRIKCTSSSPIQMYC